MNSIHYLYITFFSFWLLITLLYQLPLEKWKTLRWILSLNIFALIPKWTFFAPNPGHSDYYLLYRDIWFNGNVSNWKEINLGRSNSYIKPFWNPMKRKSKALHDLYSHLLKELTQDKNDINRIKISLPYLILLHYVNFQDHSIYSEKVQFVILESFGYNKDKEPAVLLLSDVHKLC